MRKTSIREFAYTALICAVIISIVTPGMFAENLEILLSCAELLVTLGTIRY